MPTKSDLQQIGNLMDEKLDETLDKKLKPIKKDLSYLKKTIDVLVKRTEEANVKLERRVKRIQNQLAI